MNNELAPHVAGFIDKMYEIFCDNAWVVDNIGGNFLLHLGPKGSWTFVTSGERFGIHEGATEDEIDCAVGCAEGLLEALLSGEEVDLEEAAEQNFIRLVGDYRIFDRFLSLSQAPKNAVALRAAG